MEAVVDRIEGDVAVLEIDGERFEDAPLVTLPAGTRQGDVLTGGPGAWKRDDARRAERQKSIDDLRKRLFR